MSAAFRVAGTPFDGGAGTVTTTPAITVPAGVVAADWVLLEVAWTGTAGETPPTVTASGTGWSVVMAARTENNSGWAILKKTGLTAGDTFTVSTSSGRFLTIGHVYYRDTAGPGTPGAVTGRAGVSLSTTTAASSTTTEPSQTVVVVSTERTTAVGTTVSNSGGATQRHYFEGTGGSTSSVYFADFTGPSTAGATSAVTTTYSGGSGNGAAVQVPMLAASAPAATLTRATQALPGTDRVRVAALTANATAVRLAVSTSSGMTSPTYGASQAPDAQGYSKHEVSGLAADTDYYWQTELDGVLTGTVGRAHTLPTAGGRSFSFLAASCSVTGSTDGVFTAMKDRTGAGGRRPLFFAHLGDVHYAHSGGGSAPNDAADHRTNYEAGLQSATQAPLYRDVPLSHSWSDNDFCGSNSDSTYTGRPAAITARRQLLADPPLPDTGGNGLWTSWVVGRVRFIRTDSRTYMAAKASADNSGKSMLGTEQRAWLLDQLAAPQPVKVWFHDMAWAGSPITPGSVDDWRVFSTERAQIAAHIAAVGARVIYVHGDQHRLSADDGTNNAYGGFPVIGCAPMDKDASSSWPWVAQSAYPSTGTIDPAHLYGWFDVTDTGGALISVDFAGYDATGTARVGLETIFVTLVPAVGSGVLGFTATAAGKPTHRGTAAAAPAFAAAGTGRVTRRAVAIGQPGFTAQVTARPQRRAMAAAALGFASVASARPNRLGSGSVMLGFTAASTGQVAGNPVGVGTATLGFAATAAGRPRRAGTASAAAGFAVIAVGRRIVEGTVAVPVQLVFAAAGRRTVWGAGASTALFAAAAGGTSADVPAQGVAQAVLTFTATALSPPPVLDRIVRRPYAGRVLRP